MASLVPFRAWRYDPARVPVLSRVVTQPYDKITPALREGYYAASPHNICRVILEKDADHAKAAATLSAWMEEGVLKQDAKPSIYPYFQSYRTRDGLPRTRKAFIAAAVLEPLGSGVRAHERTLAGPKADRLSLTRAARAFAELIFLLYDDPGGEVNAILDSAAAGEPRGATDEDGNAHSLWALDDPERIRRVQELLKPSFCLIADGHHRYETALSYQKENPLCTSVPAAFVALQDPGLTILPTHRAVHSVKGFDPARLLARLAADFEVAELKGTGGDACAEACARWTFALALQDGRAFRLRLKRPDPGKAFSCDVAVLHALILEKHLGIGAKEMENETNLHYFRSPEDAFDTLRNRRAQAVFFVPPTSLDDVRRASEKGERMPQKSTDFYPKLLSGLAVYKIGD